MTTPLQVPRTGPYSGDGASTVFAYNFWLTADSELVVILVDADGVETVQTLSTHYTVSGVGSKVGGDVTFVTAPASGEEVWFLRVTPQQQTTDFQNRRSFRAQTVEDRLDDLTRMVQDINEVVDRGIPLPVSANEVSIEFPAPLASYAIVWNEAGTALENKLLNSDVLLDVPGSSTDHAVVRFDGTSGKKFLNSAVTIDDDGKLYVDSKEVQSTLGQHTSLMMANAMVPTTTKSAEAYSAELATNDVMVDGLAFDASTDEHAQMVLQMPKAWDGGTLIFQFLWTSAAGSAGNVVWGVQGRALADGDALDQSWGTAQTVTDAWQANDDMHISAETAALTLAGTPDGEQAIVLDFYRDADNASDTMSGDAILQVVRMHYTTDAATDS